MSMADVLERILLRPKLERILFGMTAEEAVAKRQALIEESVDRTLQRMIDGLDMDDDDATVDSQQ